jgi:hypothetical protein|tara:strand:+ start:423 stop:602 length:180 start_codon:yes stop_codon:yes gene_type:complete
MWMLLCRPIIIPLKFSEQTTMVSTDMCKIVTVSPTNDESRYVIDIVEDAPEIKITPPQE